MADLKATLGNLGGVGGIQMPAPRSTIDKPTSGPGFDSLLKGQLGELQQKPTLPNIGASSVRFSAHALDRIQSRGIKMDQETLTRLSDAVDKAAKKGARESLMLTEDAALIVNIKNKMVITAMDKETMRENVFTNIDSTVIL